MPPNYSGFYNPSLFYWQDKSIKKSLIKLAGSKIINDVPKHLTSKHLADKQIIMYGDLEDELGDIIIPKTEHALNNAYIKAIGKLL